jgi:recombination protein RecT
VTSRQSKSRTATKQRENVAECQQIPNSQTGGNNMANAVATTEKYGITQNGVDYVTNQLVEKEKAGLCFPPNYSVKNAMQSAYLMLREAENKDHKPLLEVCTQESVVQSLMQMATQGLNPIKKQCYFVAYGNKCQLVPSYFGTLAVLNRVKNLKRQPIANVVREGDVFEYGYDLDTMELTIRKHETSIDNLDKPVIAVYAIITTDKECVVEIMSRHQLESAWAQGQQWKAAKKNGYESVTHKNFPEEMAKKTVLNRAAKRLINATDDSSIMGEEFIQAFNDTVSNDTLDVVEEQVKQDVEENANSVPFSPVAIEHKETPNTMDAVKSAINKQTVVEPVSVSGTEEGDLVPDFMK